MHNSEEINCGTKEVAKRLLVDALGVGLYGSAGRARANDGYYEWLRKAEALTKPKPSGPPPIIYAKGSMEWQAQREELKRNS